MSLKFKCIHCDTEITSKFLKVGEMAECKKCGEKTNIPISAEKVGRHRENRSIETKKKPTIFTIGKNICLVGGVLLFVMAFTQDGAPQQAAAAALACFMGIISRIFQAEEHHLSK